MDHDHIQRLCRIPWVHFAVVDVSRYMLFDQFKVAVQDLPLHKVQPIAVADVPEAVVLEPIAIADWPEAFDWLPKAIAYEFVDFAWLPKAAADVPAAFDW